MTNFRSQWIRLVTALFLLVASKAYSLGLGEMQVTSVINEPLAATIPVLNADGVQRSELIVALGSASDYEATGVTWDFTHSELQFDVTTAANGQLVVNVTSSRPIREPYLNMLVQARWPAGRLLMEYTVLLDFPVFSGEGSTASNSSSSSSSSVSNAIASAPAPQETSRPAPAPAATNVPTQAAPAPRLVSGAPASSRVESLADDEFRIQNGDTLWSLGGRVAQDLGVSRHQAMLAIREANPDAFIQGDINMLRSGSVVRIPPRSATLARSETQAIADFSRAMSGGAIADVTPLQSRVTDFRNEAASDQAGTAQFRLTAGNQTDTGVAGSGVEELVEENQSLSDTNAALEEELAAARIANRDLTERLQNLEEQIQVMEALIEVENNEIRAVQEAVTTAQPVVQPVSTAVVEEQGLMGRVMSWLPLVGLVLVGLLVGAYLLIRRQKANTGGFDDAEYVEDVAVFEEQDDAAQDPEPEPSSDELELPEVEAAPEVEEDTDLDDFMGIGDLDAEFEEPAPVEAGETETAEQSLDDTEEDWGSDFDDLDSFFSDAEDSDEGAEPEEEESEKTQIFDAAAMAALTSESTENESGQEDDVFDLDMDEETLDEAEPDLDEGLEELLDTDTGSEEPEAPEQVEDEDEENILDFSLDEESLDLPEESTSAETPAEEDDAFSMDFDLDVDDLPAQDSPEPEPAVEPEEDENTLSFDVSDMNLSTDPDDESTDQNQLNAEPEVEVELEAGAEQGEIGEVEVTEPEAEDDAEDDLSGFSFDDLEDDSAVELEDSDTEDLDSLLEGLGDLDEEPAETDMDDEVEDFLVDLPEDDGETDEAAAFDLDTDDDLQLPDLDEGVDDLLSDFGDSDLDEEEDSLVMNDSEESETKLELASAYMEMGDNTGAKELLDEVIRDGDEDSKAKAKAMLDSIS